MYGLHRNMNRDLVTRRVLDADGRPCMLTRKPLGKMDKQELLEFAKKRIRATGISHYYQLPRNMADALKQKEITSDQLFSVPPVDFGKLKAAYEKLADKREPNSQMLKKFPNVSAAAIQVLTEEGLIDSRDFRKYRPKKGSSSTHRASA